MKKLELFEQWKQERGSNDPYAYLREIEQDPELSQEAFKMRVELYWKQFADMIKEVEIHEYEDETIIDVKLNTEDELALKLEDALEDYFNSRIMSIAEEDDLEDTVKRMEKLIETIDYEPEKSDLKALINIAKHIKEYILWN